MGDVRRRYLPELASVPEARRLVARSLDEWGLAAVADDAALCTAELVTNAVLHAGTDLEVSVLRLGGGGGGVQVAVHDSSPRRLPPVMVEQFDVDDLDALEGLLLGETMSGRGLRVVDQVASAWGVDYVAGGKVVWFRLVAGGAGHSGRAVAAGGATGRPEPPPDGRVTVQLLDLPVRASIASGNDVDDILRELQLLARDPGRSNGPAPQVIAEVERLLERSVEDRLTSRALARAAVAAGERRFSMTLRMPRWGTGQVAALNEMLELVAASARAGELLTMPPGPEVVELRRWCAEEVDRQLRGAAPRRCPLPD